MMTDEAFAKHFEGKTAEEIERAKEFVKLYCTADQDTRTATEEFLTACTDGMTTEDAINAITNEATRKRWLEVARENGILDKPIEMTA